MAVDQVQVQQHNGHVALCVLLLIDGECEITVGDRLHGFAGQVDGADHDVATNCLGGRLCGLRGDVGVESEHRVDVRISLELGLDLGLALGDVGESSAQLQVLDVAERVSGAVAALLETDVVLLLDRAEHLRLAGFLELEASLLTSDELVLTHVGERTEVLEDLGAGVHGDDGDSRLIGLGQRVRDCVRIRSGNRDALAALGNEGLDQLRLQLSIVGRLLVRELNGKILASLVSASLGDRPESATVTVGDHADLGSRATGITGVTGIFACRGVVRGLCRAIAVGARAPRQHKCRCRNRGDGKLANLHE